MQKTKQKQLAHCLEKFGLIDKPIVNKDLTIIGGHQRVRILLAQKVKDVECWVCNEQLSEKEAEELALSLNKKTGDWDWDVLANEFDIESLLSGGFEAQDFTGKGQKEAKPRVTFDFDTKDSLDSATESIIEFSNKLSGCKVRFNNAG